MGGGSPERANTPIGAVFLSYASQDAEAAQNIRDALRAAGIEVWVDKSELSGGEVWDRQCEQIHNCRLFISVIQNTEAVMRVIHVYGHRPPETLLRLSERDLEP